MLLKLVSRGPLFGGLLLTSLLVYWSPLGSRDSYSQVREILQETRWTEGRLVGFEFQPCGQGEAGCNGTATLTISQVRELALLRQDLVADGEGSEVRGLHALGLYNLAWQDPKDLEESTMLLRQAHEIAPDDAGLLSDLTTALLKRGRLDKNALLDFMALDAALASTTKTNVPIEAHFNRALALGRLNLPGAAQAWRDYLEEDPSSPWSDEARAYLSALETNRRSDDLDPARMEILEGLTTLERSATEERSAKLDELLSIAHRIQQNTGDPLLLETVDLLKATEDPVELRSRLAAHDLFSKGMADYRQGDYQQAIARLADAGSRFHYQKDPLEHYANFYAGAADYMSHRYEDSLQKMVLLEQTLQKTPYSYIQGMVYWMQGANLLMLGRSLESKTPYQTALQRFEKTHSVDNAAVLLSLLGERAFELGQAQEAWDYFKRALAFGPSLRQPKRIASVLQPIVTAAHEQQLYHTAGMLADLLVANNEKVADKQILFLSLISRATIAADRDDIEAAKRDLETAQQTAMAIYDPDVRQRVDADLAVLEARLSIGNPAPLIDNLETAIGKYASWNFNTFVHSDALEVQSRLRLRVGDSAGAADDLEKSLRIFEESVLNDHSTLNRWSMRLKVRKLYDRLIELKIDALAAPRDAFEIAERAAELSLLSFDLPASRVANRREALDLQELEANLPRGWGFITYRLIGNRLLTWRISAAETVFREQKISRAWLQSAIGQIHRAGTLPEAIPEETLVELGNLLIGQLPESLTQLIVVPDQELHSLPFALLMPAGRRLVDRFPLLTAPSVGVFLEALQRLDAKRPTGKVMVVSDPLIAPELTAELNLRPLDKTDEEGRLLASLYPGAQHWTGSQATVEAFLSFPRDLDILHFATHAIINPEKPENSFLLLATSPDRTGALYQNELYRLRWTEAPLIVLSACDTGVLTGTNGEGISSLARAFLSSGASAVLATLWPVQDKSAYFLATHFHRELAAGASAAEALRRAQLSYLSHKSLVQADPIGWSAFQLIGASR